MCKMMLGSALYTKCYTFMHNILPKQKQQSQQVVSMNNQDLFSDWLSCINVFQI